jgi:imidazolonepropionase-like amidohydrolase
MTTTGSRTVFRHGAIFDGTGAAAAPGDVVIDGGRIVAVGPQLDADVEIDATGMTILPGLFDCHTHVVVSGLPMHQMLSRPFSYQFYEAARNLARTLDCGITTVRDAAGADLGIRKAVDDGLIEGPRMHISITALSQTGGHCDGWQPSGICVTPVLAYPGRPAGIADGPDQLRREVREIIRSGADVIKVCASGGVMSPTDNPEHAQFRDDELLAIVAEADAVDLPVMVHAHSAKGIKASLRAGVRSIEHGTYLDDESIDLMLERGTWLVPTLHVVQAVIDAADAGAGFPESTVRKARGIQERHRESFSRAAAAGVRIALGTDSGVIPHGSNLRELDAMVSGGLTHAQALVAATSSAADLLGLGDELGTIEPGKRADLVLVDGDATNFTDLKARVRAVYKDGIQVR